MCDETYFELPKGILRKVVLRNGINYEALITLGPIVRPVVVTLFLQHTRKLVATAMLIDDVDTKETHLAHFA